MIQGRCFHPKSQGAIERLNHFVGQFIQLVFFDFQEKKENNQKSEIENVPQ